MLNRPPVIGDFVIDDDESPWGDIYIVIDVNTNEVTFRLISEINGPHRRAYKSSQRIYKKTHIDFQREFSYDIMAMIQKEIAIEYSDLKTFYGLDVGLLK